MGKSKIDNEIFLDLAKKGLSPTEIARYFDVNPSSVRSKAMTLSKVHPEIVGLISAPTAEKQLPVDTRLTRTLDRYMVESSKVQKHLATIPLDDSLDHLGQRNDIIFKGLQILEKIQKISTPSNQEQSRSLQTNTISVYLSQSGKNNSEPEPIDVQDVTS